MSVFEWLLASCLTLFTLSKIIVVVTAISTGREF